MKKALLILGVALLAAIPAQAALVQVEVSGYVEYNQIRSGNLSNANPGDPVLVSFMLDSDVFTNSPNFPTRGYAIDVDSYVFTAGAVTEVLRKPWPAGDTPYFVLRDNDPAVDGFFVAVNNVDWPFPGLYLNQFGFFDWFTNHIELGYGGDQLDSLDILDALGLYDYDGLTRFYFTVNDGPFEPLGIGFQQMTISLVPVEVPVDIKPGSCPNPINRRSRGVVPVAIMGTETLDVTTIDPASIRLEGVAPLHSGFEDVGEAFMPYVGKEFCHDDCNDWGPDGWMDLTVKFDTMAIVNAVGQVSENECLVLQLTGNFTEEYGGGPIVGEDVVVPLHFGTPGRGEAGPDRTARGLSNRGDEERPVRMRLQD